jgi:NitT/TauT family transport system substrate-binding protein
MIKMLEEKPALAGTSAVEYQVLDNPELITSKMMSGEIDFAALPTNLAANLYNKGIPYQIAAISSWGVMYAVSTDPSIKDWAGLKGEKIYVFGKGTTPDIVFRYLLQKNGLNPDTDVQLDYTLGQVELAQSIIAGRVSLAVLPEPWVTQAAKGNSAARVVLDLQKEWEKAQGGQIAMTVTCLAVKKDLAQKHPEVVDSFLKYYKESIGWVNQNPAQAGQLVEKHQIGLKAAVAQEAIPRCYLRYADAKESMPAVKSFLKVLFEFAPQSIGGKLPDDEFYYQK